MVIPDNKKTLVRDAEKQVVSVQQQYLDGAITNGERYNKVIEIWSAITEKVADEMFGQMQQRDKEGLINPIYVMADSGARGSKQQIRQLSGMRGLMAKPSGEIIETPITANFREGLTVLEYFISTHGARKGLADTALKTADSGYLTRRLVDVAQDVIISEYDCGTVDGIYVSGIVEAGEIIEPLRDRIVGRVSLEKIKDYDGNVIVDINQEITEELAGAIQAAGIERVKIRSVLTCESKRGVCVMCYGRNLASGRLVELGEATGVIAAQSIGEPGTQLTMRTFHIGGTASRVSEQSRLEAKNTGAVRFISLQTVKAKSGDLVVMNRQGSIAVVDEKGRERERYSVVYGAKVKVNEGDPVQLGQVLVEWDPYTFAILTEIGGTVQFKDLQEGITLHEEVDEVTGLSRHVVADSPDEKRQPAIVIKGKAQQALPDAVPRSPHGGRWRHGIPGDVLAKIPRETTKTKDITGGLPRVVELFEARKPHETAVISEIDGTVKFGEVSKGQRKIYVVADNGTEKEYSVPRGVHINVQEGERVKAGEPLMDGPLNPHDILAVLGEKELQSYLVNEIQEVYRLQGVNISDKHIEVIVRQMMRWRKVEDVGDTPFLLEQQVDKFRFARRERARDQGRWTSGNRPAAAARYHQGVALDRLVHLGGVVPGDHARAHRSFHPGSGGSPARPEGERHRRTPHPCRHRHGVLPQRAPLARNGRGRCEGAGGGFRSVRGGRARARTDAARRRDRRTGRRVIKGTEKGRDHPPLLSLSSYAVPIPSNLDHKRFAAAFRSCAWRRRDPTLGQEMLRFLRLLRLAIWRAFEHDAFASRQGVRVFVDLDVLSCVARRWLRAGHPAPRGCLPARSFLCTGSDTSHRRRYRHRVSARNQPAPGRFADHARRC